MSITFYLVPFLPTLCFPETAVLKGIVPKQTLEGMVPVRNIHPLIGWAHVPLNA